MALSEIDQGSALEQENTAQDSYGKEKAPNHLWNLWTSKFEIYAQSKQEGTLLAFLGGGSFLVLLWT
jgi:hypothetical protein